MFGPADLTQHGQNLRPAGGKAQLRAELMEDVDAEVQTGLDKAQRLGQTHAAGHTDFAIAQTGDAIRLGPGVDRVAAAQRELAELRQNLGAARRFDGHEAAVGRDDAVE